MSVARGMAEGCYPGMAYAHLLSLPEPLASDFDVQALKARLLVDLGYPDRAIDEILLKLNPAEKDKRATLHLTLAFAHGASGNTSQAVESALLAEKNGSPIGFVYSTIGHAHWNAGDETKAELALLRAIDDMPDLPPALYLLSLLRAKQGRNEEAIEYLERAWDAGLQDPRLLESNPLFAQLRMNTRWAAFAKSDRRRCAY